MNYAGACPTLAIQGIRYRIRKMFGLRTYPTSVTITITRRCNSRCTMCNIWRMHKKTNELSLEEILRFLSSPYFSRLVELDLTGGEPFLREDFTLLIEKICELSKHNLTGLKTIALATNGLRPDIVVPTVREVLNIINSRFDLAIVCSVDGLEKTHDLIRGIPGGYKKVMSTIAGLRELSRGRFPFWLGVKTTILPLNRHEIPQLIRFAKERQLFHIVSPVLFATDRFCNMNRKPELELLPSYSQDLVDLYSSEERRDSYYSHVVSDSLKRSKRRIGCSAGMDHFFVEGDGRIFPCPLVSRTLGNLKTDSLEVILDSRKRRAASRLAGKLDICGHCFEPGCIRFSQSGEAWGFLRFILGNRGLSRFRKAYYDEGFWKYF